MIGIIGGSGVFGLNSETPPTVVKVETKWGTPSAGLSLYDIGGRHAAFLPRHGEEHEFLPHEVNYRANMDLFKQAGAKFIVAVCSVGSLREEYRPGDYVVPNQLIDFTRGRESSYYGKGTVHHEAVPDPFSPIVGRIVEKAVLADGGTVHSGGTYIAVNGPRFSTRAESNLFRAWGADLVGMTAAPEAFLAAELGIPYAVLCLVTDYDCWKKGEEDVSHDLLIKRLGELAGRAQNIVTKIAGNVP